MYDSISENQNLKNQFQNKETLTGLPKIKLIGCGGGGGNMLNYIAKNILTDESSFSQIDLIAMNTDAQALNNILIPNEKKVTLGVGVTKGMGAGMQPEKGAQAAIESEDIIKKQLVDTEILFLSGGLGGGTGSGALPEIAKIAQKLDILTIAVVTKPFTWEGNKRMGHAMKSLMDIEQLVDSLIVIPNDKLVEYKIANNEPIGLNNAFELVNKVLASAVFSLTSIIIENSENNINLDFADVKNIMKYKGKALMTIGKGSNSEEAILSAIESPLLENFKIDGSKGVLINFKVNPNISLLEINKGMELISSKVDENDAEIIFGTIYDNNLKIDEIEVVLVATGFNEDEKFEELKQKIKPMDNKILESKKEEKAKPIETTKTKRFEDNLQDVKTIPAFIRNKMKEK